MFKACLQDRASGSASMASGLGFNFGAVSNGQGGGRGDSECQGS